MSFYVYIDSNSIELLYKTVNILFACVASYCAMLAFLCKNLDYKPQSINESYCAQTTCQTKLMLCDNNNNG